MDTENLVKMANNIGDFFSAEPDQAAAVHGAFDHLKKFWEPRMRRAIILHYRAGGEGLNDLARAAVRQLDEESTALHSTGDG